MNETDSGALQQIWAQLREYVSLKYGYAKLLLAEKLSVVISTLLIVFLAVCLGSIAIFFLSTAVVEWIAESLSPAAGHAIVGCAYAVILILLFIFRKQLVINPIARFISRQIL